MPIRDDDTIAIRKPTGGNAEETHTLDALREYVTEDLQDNFEELDDRLTAIEEAQAPALAQEDGITAGDVDPDTDISLTKDTFVEAEAEDETNWLFDAGTTGLALDTITYTSATLVNAAFTGTATAGTGRLIAVKEVFAGERLASDVLTITVLPEA